MQTPIVAYTHSITLHGCVTYVHTEFRSEAPIVTPHTFHYMGVIHTYIQNLEVQAPMHNMYEHMYECVTYVRTYVCTYICMYICRVLSSEGGSFSKCSASLPKPLSVQFLEECYMKTAKNVQCACICQHFSPKPKFQDNHGTYVRMYIHTDFRRADFHCNLFECYARVSLFNYSSIFNQKTGVDHVI